jgi:hypothetical protein
MAKEGSISSRMSVCSAVELLRERYSELGVDPVRPDTWRVGTIA